MLDALQGGRFVDVTTALDRSQANETWMYWYRPAPDQDIEVVQIAILHGHNLHIYMLGHPDLCPKYGQLEGEWAGPLEAPPRKVSW